MTIEEMDAVASKETLDLFKDIALKSKVKTFPKFEETLKRILNELHSEEIYESFDELDKRIFEKYQ